MSLSLVFGATERERRGKSVLRRDGLHRVAHSGLHWFVSADFMKNAETS